jgi:hypothetical protein
MEMVAAPVAERRQPVASATVQEPAAAEQVVVMVLAVVAPPVLAATRPLQAVKQEQELAQARPAAAGSVAVPDRHPTAPRGPDRVVGVAASVSRSARSPHFRTPGYRSDSRRPG